MKTVMKFLSLLLCFELVISPVQGSLFLPAVALAETCPAGQAWSDAVGRCQVTADTINDNNAVDACGDDKACLEKVAKDKSGVTGENPFSDGTGTSATWGKNGSGSVASAVAIGIPLLIVTSVLLSHKKRKTAGSSNRCRPASLLLMYAAAGALGVGEIYGYFHHKSELDKMQKKWDATVVHKEGSGIDKRKTEATEAQSQAFEYLAQNEDLVASTAKTKKGFYIAATSLFAAGAIAATVEQVQLGIAKKVLTPAAAAAATAAKDTTYPQRAEQARQKIAKLTCSTDDAVKPSDEAIAHDKSLAEKAAAEKAATTTAGGTTANANSSGVLSSSSSSTTTYTDGTVVQTNSSTVTTPVKPVVKPVVQPFIGPLNQPAGGGTNNQANPPFTNPRFESPTNGANIDPKFARSLSTQDFKKLKKVAEYNLSTAKDAEQLLQLMNELNSIEFENYTKITYLEEDQAQDLKKIPLLTEVSKKIANAIIPSAHAQDTGCAAADTAAADAAAAAAATAATAEPENNDVFGKISGVVGTALPLVLGLKSIMGGVKSQGGVPLAPGELDKNINQVDGKIMKAIGKPYTRIIINSLLGGWMGIMIDHMDTQQENAENRAVKLRKMKEEFVASNGLLYCKEEDRSNSCKPICYCYTPDNRRNPDRAKDKVCMNTFANMKYDPFGNKGDDKVCLDQNQRVDAKCACRAKKTCMKISSAYSMGGFHPGAFRMMGTAAGPAQDLFNGNVGGGNISDSAGINAANIRKAADNMLAKTDPKAFKAKAGLMASMEKGFIAAGSGLSMGGSGASALPTTPAGAAAALDKELKEHKADKINTAGSTANGSGYSEDEEPEAVMTEDASGEDIEIADVMGKEVDTGDSDVNTSSHTNIFEVLSNRYQRSGMRRLFEENSTAPVDAPSKTELAD